MTVVAFDLEPNLNKKNSQTTRIGDLPLRYGAEARAEYCQSTSALSIRTRINFCLAPNP